MFKTFPQFTKLTLAHKDEYEAFIKQFPPISEISFPTVMTWWNTLQPPSVAWLNGNLVITYWLPGDDANSGLSLIGTHDVDESICAIFDFLKERGDPPRLVHVSEFVIRNVRFPELFAFREERDYDECVVPIAGLFPLSQAPVDVRRKIERFKARMGEGNLGIVTLKLETVSDKLKIAEAAQKYWGKGGANNSPLMTQEALTLTLIHAESLGVEAVAVMIRGVVRGFYVYHKRRANNCVISNYIMFDPKLPGLEEFLFYIRAEKFAGEGMENINIDFDLGQPLFRGRQLVLGPFNFYRKYTIEPLSSSLTFYSKRSIIE